MKKLAVIGCGLRADCYLHEMRDGLGKEWQLVALADTNPKALEVYQRNYRCGDARKFDSGPDLLSAMRGALDAVIIGTPNALHVESILPALEQGLMILLEKPVATTQEDCLRIWQSCLVARRPPVAVGFVLRYTAFYSKIKAMIDSGVIGQVLTLQAAEMLDQSLSAAFARGWRRKTAMAGPVILEKCCHDMDILNWLAGAPAVAVSSFGTRTRFVADETAAMHCSDCQKNQTCPYAPQWTAPYIVNAFRMDEVKELVPFGDDLCVFNSDKDIWDHQVVNIAYQNGVLAGFTMCMDQPRTTRTLTVCGTKGQIIGDIESDFLELRHKKYGIKQEFVEKVPLEHDLSGHHGGDSVITAQFKAMLRGEKTPPLAGLEEGINAALVALGAEQAFLDQRIVTSPLHLD